MKDGAKSGFRDAQEDIATSRVVPQTPQTEAPSYRLAFADDDFLLRQELRPVRLQLELLKPELMMEEQGVRSTIVLFGGARIVSDPSEASTPGMAGLAHFYEVARKFAQLMTERSLAAGGQDDVIVTGGGPGVMEAGNRGAAEAGGRSMGLSIVLPHEHAPNGWVTPDLCFNFHYFAVRKMHFLMRARALAIFPGGFGTMDEMFEALTLIQTGRMRQVPVLLFGRAFWERVVDFEALAQFGTISRADLDLFRFVETAEQAMETIDAWPDAGEKRGAIPGR